jgi:ABC-2 type transport system ATP-binding protein
MILGLDRPTAGTATIDGQAYRQIRNPLHKVGALLDAKATHPARSARSHLLWMAQASGISKNRVDEVLSLVGLTEVAGKKAGGFSLGMGQRLGIAGALLGDPEVLILDEPVNGLDPEGIRWVRSLLKSLAAEGRTVLVSSHLLSEMALTADNLVVIGRGKLVADTSVREFIKDHSTVTTIVRTQHIDEFKQALTTEKIDFKQTQDEDARAILEIPDRHSDEIGALAFSTGVMLSERSERQASLEEAFMSTTEDSVQYHGGISGGAAEEPAAEAQKPATEATEEESK